MTPDQVRETAARLQHAVAVGDDDVSGEAALQLCCGAALNLAIIAATLQEAQPPA